MKFRKRPLEVEAIRWTGENLGEIAQAYPEHAWCAHEGKLYVETLNGYVKAAPGEWIVKGVVGEVYPVAPDVFEKTFEPVNEP